MIIVQATLRNLNGKNLLTTWLDKKPELREGAIITLKDFKPEDKWRVEQLYKREFDDKEFEFHRKWDNNNYEKHEGLFKKK